MKQVTPAWKESPSPILPQAPLTSSSTNKAQMPGVQLGTGTKLTLATMIASPAQMATPLEEQSTKTGQAFGASISWQSSHKLGSRSCTSVLAAAAAAKCVFTFAWDRRRT